MHRYLFLALLLSLSQICTSQEIKSFDYWFDGDVSNLVNVAASSIEIETEIDASNLASGIHVLTLRALDSNGVYSSPINKCFYRFNKNSTEAEICSLQYWIDDNINDCITKDIDRGNINLIIDVESIPYGIHTLTFRAFDTNNNYSSPITVNFLHFRPTGDIVKYRYWIDGNIENLTETALTDGEIVKIGINAEYLSRGVHTISYQIADSNGTWSVPISNYFIRTGQGDYGDGIDACEYWFDDNDNIATIVDVTGNDIIMNIGVEDLDEGEHIINFRVRSCEGIWSPVTIRPFIISNEGGIVFTQENLVYLTVTDSGIIVNGAEDAAVFVYTISGQLFKSCHKLSENHFMDLPKNTYLITIIDNGESILNSKVIVK